MAEYIEREKTVELLRSLGNREYRKEKGTIQDAIKMISYPEYTPTADVAQVVHAEWVVCGDGDNVPWMCSHCGKTTAHKYKVIYGKYCPNCGAKMDGGVGNEVD